MKDIRIVKAQALLQVFSFAPIRGFVPASIVVLGKDLNKTTEVIINGITANEFFIQSAARMIVKLPLSQVGQTIASIKVLSSVPLTQKDAALAFRIDNPPQTVDGIDRLIQSWLMIFMSTPGSDIFSPRSGGGALSLIGRTTDSSGKGAAADLAASIERTNTEILRLQSKDKKIPPSEKLLSSSLVSMSFNPSTTALSARVEIRNQLMDGSVVSLG